MIGIYKLTSPSGKVYIGQSIDIDKRLRQYKNGHCKSQTAIYRAIMKYGWENIKVEILCSSEDSTNATDRLNKLEISFIKLYESLGIKGYNLQSGGNAKGISEETRKKMSEWQIGKTLSEETKQKMSDYWSIPIIQLDKLGNFIKEWPSATLAGKELNITQSGISRVVRGERKTAGGFKWIKKEIQ